MRWPEICDAYPNAWLVIEALDAHTEDRRRIFGRITVVEVCADGVTALRRYRELRRANPGSELLFVHTGNAELEIDERPWIGIRVNDAPLAPG